MDTNEVDFSKIQVAYFSMEIAINSKIPTYSGGLGVLAGDMLRSAADLKVPMMGITLLYNKGYFNQKISSSGEQIEKDENWKLDDFMEKLEPKIKVKLRNREVSVQAWLYKQKGITGKTSPIIFLDTNLEENSEYDRQLTSHLYGGEDEYRLSQEVILGIGGLKMIEILGCKNIQKYHMNEGHSALLTIELYNQLKDIEKVREKCVFTTHTPVPAGHDQFDKKQAQEILYDYIQNEIQNDIFLNNKLNMTYLGLRFSKHINGVAKKHTEVSKKMFPGYHIESITNGVHSVFWTSDDFKKLFDKYIPNWRSDSFNLRYVMSIPKEKIWSAHFKSKQKLINFVNKKTNSKMNEKIFTIGFARRMTGYKRGDLLLSNIDKLTEIANNSKGIQIIYAGKAHPNDKEGKEIIKRIIEKSSQLKGKIKLCYLENYNLEIAKMLISGVDIWLNNPLRPREASGTSGMKAAHNGVPQLSILDGWWLEGHIENITGWSIGSPIDEAIKNNNSEDLEDLYSKLEYVILPTFYSDRDKWLSIMRHTISINASFFNTQRMLQQYVLMCYFE